MPFLPPLIGIQMSQRGQSHNLPGGGNSRDTMGILGVGQLSQVYSHLSLRPRLAYDVISILELAG